MYIIAVPAVSENEECFEAVQQLLGNILHPLNIESTNEKKSVCQDFCSLFIQLTNHFSKAMCIELVNRLHRNRDVLPSFTEKFKCYDDFLNF